jgi:hypothetical protein
MTAPLGGVAGSDPVFIARVALLRRLSTDSADWSLRGGVVFREAAAFPFSDRDLLRLTMGFEGAEIGALHESL